MRLGDFHPASHDVVLGVPQSGKTTLVRRLVAPLRRVLFFDPTGHDYTGEGEACSPADLDTDELLLEGRFARVVVVPGHDQAGDFRRVVAAARRAGKRRPLMLVADEVGNYSAKTADTLTTLHCNGHHDGVTSVLVSQFAVQVPKTCRRSATRVVSLLQDLKDDLDALRADYGDAFAARVAAWNPGDPPAVWTRRTLHHPHRRSTP